MWLTVVEAIRRAGLKKLADLTSNRNEQVPIGLGAAGATQTIDLPFYRSTAAKLVVYQNGSVSGSAVALTVGGATDGNDRIVLTPGPTLDHVLAVISDGVYVDDLNDALKKAQGEIRAALGAVGSVPSDTISPTLVSDLLKGWAWDMAAYYLVTDVKRAPLLESYPEIGQRYFHLVGGGPDHEPGLLKWYGSGKGDLSGSGVIPVDTSGASEADDILFISEDSVFDPPSWY